MAEAHAEKYQGGTGGAGNGLPVAMLFDFIDTVTPYDEIRRYQIATETLGPAACSGVANQDVKPMRHTALA